MARKYRATEISGTVNIKPNGQHMQANWLCVSCHAIGKYETHYPDCKHPESYAIPATAEAPRKRANKRIWEIFKRQFVYARPNGYWFDIDSSWWGRKGKYKQEGSND